MRGKRRGRRKRKRRRKRRKEEGMCKAFMIFQMIHLLDMVLCIQSQQ